MGGVRSASMRVLESGRAARALGAVAAILIAMPAAAFAQSWPYAHANGANNGFTNVVTAPAAAGSTSVPNIGTFAPGAGPVIAQDGTLYLGNQQGRLMAFSATGTPIWNVGLSGGEPIVSSGLISKDFIYVVGAREREAALYKFDANGSEIFRSPFPPHQTGPIMTTAPTNMQLQRNELIVLPTTYKSSGAPVYETRLIAFDSTGPLLLDQKIDTLTPSASGSFGSASIAPGKPDIPLPLPMAAIHFDLTNGEPWLVVADGFQSLIIYKLGSAGLMEGYRRRDKDNFRSFNATPTIAFDNSGRNQVVLANSAKGVLSWQPDATAEYTEVGIHSASAPARSTNFGPDLYVWNDRLVIRTGNGPQTVAIPGRSIVAPAVGADYFYVSSEDAFTTYSKSSATNYRQVARFDWVGGGVNIPAIGPQGHVYAIASNILFIFPPPKAILLSQPVVKTFDAGGNASAPPPPQPASTLPPSQLYHPPLTASGNRLFACNELDGDDCGKGDYNEISLAWCQKQGFAKVQGYDVDSRKVRAETLDGQFCSKSKCKVFDSIGCEM